MPFYNLYIMLIINIIIIEIFILMIYTFLFYYPIYYDKISFQLKPTKVDALSMKHIIFIT